MNIYFDKIFIYSFLINEKERLMKLVLIFISLVISTTTLAQESTIGENFIRLVDPLDEPEFYCIDLAGWGERIQLNDPLQTHTCKNRNADDQEFYLDESRIKASQYEVCLQAVGSGNITLPGSSLIARPCSDSNVLQNIELNNFGQIKLKDTKLCISAGTVSAAANGPSHVWRTLTFVDCDIADPSLSTWQLGL